MYPLSNAGLDIPGWEQSDNIESYFAGWEVSPNNPV